MFLQLNRSSKTLGIQTSVNILLPEADIIRKLNRPIPTLYLLHGLSDDHTGWMRYSSIERHIWPYYLAVVMPAVNRSFYVDMAHGAKYFTYVSQELPQAMETLFPLSKEREGRFEAGLSMGGYGAFRLALGLPDRYAAAANLSGALEMQEVYHMEDGAFLKEMKDAFGAQKTFLAGDNNLWNLAGRLAEDPDRAPALYMVCGTEDELLPANDHFHRDFGESLCIEYHKEPGAHTWDFWDTHIQRVLEWLPIEKMDDL
jgi:S-formylglutathione hydrolase FrmB